MEFQSSKEFVLRNIGEIEMTSVQDIYENNLRRQYSDVDGKQFDEAEKQLAANRLDVKGPGASHNLDLIDGFFQKNRSVPVSVVNIFRAVEERKTEFKWLSPSQADWYQLAQESPDRANQLAAWLTTQGQRPGQLMNRGDELFVNLSLLFAKLHGYDINSETIRQ